jgi:hypothetical protein
MQEIKKDKSVSSHPKDKKIKMSILKARYHCAESNASNNYSLLWERVYRAVA